MDRTKNLGKKFLICLILSFTIFLIVYVSEVFIAVIHDIKANPFTIPNILYFFFMVFGVIPLLLLTLWLINPPIIEKILKSFGLVEETKKETKNTKKETKEKEQNEKRKSMSKYEKFIVFFTALTLICNIILFRFNLDLVGQTNQIHIENLEFQNMMYNFTSVIVARADYANLGTPSDYSSDGNVTIRTIHYGDLDLELQVVTPHYGKVSVRYKYFNVGDSDILDQEKRNQTSVSFVSESDKYEHLVVSGLNQLSDQIHLKARVYLNPENISPDTLWLSFPLGRLFLEAELFDIQTNSTLTKEFSTVVRVEYEPLS